MSDYRIGDRENILLDGRPMTAFLLFEPRPHPIQNRCHVLVGRFVAEGHDASDHACIRAALAEIHGGDDD